MNNLISAEYLSVTYGLGLILGYILKALVDIYHREKEKEKQEKAT